MTLRFKELAGSPVETFDSGGMKAQRRLVCAYEDRFALAAALLGNSGREASLPAAYPGMSGALAVRVRLEPPAKDRGREQVLSDPATDLHRYPGELVELVVDYEWFGQDGLPPDMPEVPQGTLLTYRVDFQAESVTVPCYTLQWQSSATVPVPREVVPRLRVPVGLHYLTWHRVPCPPWAAIRACLGAVNAAEFLGGAAETMLFDGAKAEPQLAGLSDAAQPQPGWSVTYVFREKAVREFQGNEQQAVYGWNHAYRPEAASGSPWDRLIDAGGNPLYRTTDFGPLFQFATPTTSPAS